MFFGCLSKRNLKKIPPHSLGFVEKGNRKYQIYLTFYVIKSAASYLYYFLMLWSFTIITLCFGYVNSLPHFLHFINDFIKKFEQNRNILLHLKNNCVVLLSQIYFLVNIIGKNYILSVWCSSRLSECLYYRYDHGAAKISAADPKGQKKWLKLETDQTRFSVKYYNLIYNAS